MALELGDYLVHELGLSNSVDTLGRWMSHHLAEIIVQARDEKSSKKRKTAKKQAVDLIFKIWAHREKLPGSAYPLSRYKDALPIIELMNPTAGPFGSWRRSSPNSLGDLSADFFTDAQKLVIAIILLEIGWNGKRSSSVAAKALTAQERKVLQMYERLEDFLLDSNHRVRITESGTPPKNRSISEKALDLVSDLSTALGKIKILMKREIKSSKKRKKGT